MHTSKDRELARDHARLTAAKIDAIEAEMARDIMGGPSRAMTVTGPGSVAPPTKGATTVPTAPVELDETTDADDLNFEMLGGNIDAIELNESGGGSVLDETAILFSNGQLDAAEGILRAGLRRDDLGSAARLGWYMLFELVNQRGDRAAFDQLTMEYAMRFEQSPPAWQEYAAAPAGATAPKTQIRPAAGGGIGVRLPESIDAGIVGHLEQLRTLTAAHAAVRLDVSEAKSIDIAGASLLLRVIGAFRRSHHELTLVGATVLADVLSRSVESGRRDPADALWMLLLEVLRMLDRHDEFEETAIQYCVTFEVSPPSWEPPSANLKIAPATSAAALGAEAASSELPFELRGTIDGEGEPHLGRLTAAARNQTNIVIDCGQLRRLTFSAGSALFGTLCRIRQGGSTIELRNVSALVTALLHLIGVMSVASVHSRYA